MVLTVGPRACTIACVPVMPPAPGMFSITTGWPSDLVSDGLTVRMIVSTPEPGPTGRIVRSGLSDAALCARAGSGPRRDRCRDGGHRGAVKETAGTEHHASLIAYFDVDNVAETADDA